MNTSLSSLSSSDTEYLPGQSWKTDDSSDSLNSGTAFSETQSPVALTLTRTNSCPDIAKFATNVIKFNELLRKNYRWPVPARSELQNRITKILEEGNASSFTTVQLADRLAFEEQDGYCDTVTRSALMQQISKILKNINRSLLLRYHTSPRYWQTHSARHLKSLLQKIEGVIRETPSRLAHIIFVVNMRSSDNEKILPKRISYNQLFNKVLELHPTKANQIQQKGGRKRKRSHQDYNEKGNKKVCTRRQTPPSSDQSRKGLKKMAIDYLISGPNGNTTFTFQELVSAHEQSERELQHLTETSAQMNQQIESLTARIDDLEEELEQNQSSSDSSESPFYQFV